MAIHGMTGGPAFAVFTLGVLVPVANSRGVVVGFFIGTGKQVYYRTSTGVYATTTLMQACCIIQCHVISVCAGISLVQSLKALHLKWS